jgi:hypothetical protein
MGGRVQKGGRTAASSNTCDQAAEAHLSSAQVEEEDVKDTHTGAMEVSIVLIKILRTHNYIPTDAFERLFTQITRLELHESLHIAHTDGKHKIWQWKGAGGGGGDGGFAYVRSHCRLYQS